MAEPDTRALLFAARTALKENRKDDVRELLRDYRKAVRMTGAPMIALNPPKPFSSPSYREPISGDRIAKALADALTRTNRLSIIDWMTE